MKRNIIFCVVLQVICLVKAQDSSYNAAVLEYYATQDSTLSDFENLLLNKEQYVLYISQAKSKRADIIVFPEYGLTGVKLPENLENISTIVPHPSEYITPCAQNGTKNNSSFGRHLIELSCAASEHGIYAVVNLIEKEINNSTNVTKYYNTNVVFDRKGAVIARYRKINLFQEPQLTPGNELVTFTTDFGVTFGVFICFDILFETPALAVLLSDDVTDVIYSTAWYSQTPFLQALSVQDGYAKSNGINLLVSGYSDPAKSIGGSGIYHARTSAADVKIYNTKTRDLIVRPVVKIQKKLPNEVCDQNFKPTPRIDMNQGTAGFNTTTENMELYTFKDFEQGNTVIQETVCSEGSEFCCSFSVQLAEPYYPNQTVYKMAAFYGVRSLEQSTAGVRACAIVACLSEDEKSCGVRSSTQPRVKFQQISLTGKFPRNAKSYYQPSTLTYYLEPMVQYAYCRKEEDDQIEITMATNGQDSSVFTFGLFGRVYDMDGQSIGKSDAHSTNANIAILSLLFAYILFH